jgi:hypothetical protein
MFPHCSQKLQPDSLALAFQDARPGQSPHEAVILAQPSLAHGLRPGHAHHYPHLTSTIPAWLDYVITIQNYIWFCTELNMVLGLTTVGGKNSLRLLSPSDVKVWFQTLVQTRLLQN